MSRPGKLTAEDVQSVVFDQSSRLSRGYNEQQVDAFLDLVADTIEDLTTKLVEKQADTERVIGEAQRNAEAIVRRAQSVADQIENEARNRAARILAEASQRAGAMPMAPGEDFAAAAVAVGTRIGGIRDALSAELANLYRLIGKVQNGNNRPPR